VRSKHPWLGNRNGRERGLTLIAKLRMTFGDNGYSFALATFDSADLPAVKEKTQYIFTYRTTTYISCLTLRSLHRQMADAFWATAHLLKTVRTPSSSEHEGEQSGWQTLPAESEATMFKEDSVMNDQIKRAIRQRANRALTNDDLVRAVFDGFRAQSIDLRNVSLEDMKTALVEAARAAREHNPVAA
jgi:hypothetical protein